MRQFGLYVTDKHDVIGALEVGHAIVKHRMELEKELYIQNGLKHSQISTGGCHGTAKDVCIVYSVHFWLQLNTSWVCLLTPSKETHV